MEYIRAMNKWRDEVADVANQAFDTQFRFSLRSDVPGRQTPGPKEGETFESWADRVGPQETDTVMPDDFGQADRGTLVSLPWQARRELRRAVELQQSTETPLDWVWRQESRRIRAARKRDNRRKTTFKARERKS
jgi:hypothetical protein